MPLKAGRLQHGAGLGAAGGAAGIGYLRARQGVSCQEMPSPRPAAEGPVKACRPGPLASYIPLPRLVVLPGAFLLGKFGLSLHEAGLQKSPVASSAVNLIFAWICDEIHNGPGPLNGS